MVSTPMFLRLNDSCKNVALLSTIRVNQASLLSGHTPSNTSQYCFCECLLYIRSCGTMEDLGVFGLRSSRLGISGPILVLSASAHCHKMLKNLRICDDHLGGKYIGSRPISKVAWSKALSVIAIMKMSLLHMWVGCHDP